MNYVLKPSVLALGLLLLLIGTGIAGSVRIEPIVNNTNLWSSLATNNSIYATIHSSTQLHFLEQLFSEENALNITVSSYRTDYGLNTSSILPYDLTEDNSRNIWFTDYNQPFLFKVDTLSGTYTNYSLPRYINPFTIVYADNNVLWLTDFNFTDSALQIRDIMRYNITNGNITLYKIPTIDPAPFDIAIQNTSTIWFTEWYGKKIARLNLFPQPNITEYNAECADINWCGPLGITLDSQNNIWYVETYSSTLIKFNPVSQQQIRYPIPDKFLSPVSIIFDSHRNIWTGEHAGNRIVQFNPTNNTFSFYVVPYMSSFALGLNDLGIDAIGNIWFDEHFTNRIGRLDPISHTIMQYILPHHEPLIQKIYVSKMNNQVWYAEWGSNSIGMINVSRAPLMTVKVNTSHVSVSPGVNKLLNVDVNVQLNTSEPLSIMPLTQNVSDIQIYAPHFNTTLSQNQVYSFPVNITIPKTISAGIYYIPIGVQGNNYTASTTLVLQVIQNNLINGYGFVYIISMIPLLALLEQKKK